MAAASQNTGTANSTNVANGSPASTGSASMKGGGLIVGGTTVQTVTAGSCAETHIEYRYDANNYIFTESTKQH